MYFAVKDQRVAVNVPDVARLSAGISQAFREHRGFALATVNLDHLVKLKQDEAFLAAYLAQDMVVADGRPIVWLSRLAQRPVQLMPGSDLVTPLCHLAVQSGVKVAFVGSRQPVLELAAERLRHWVPGLEIAYIHAPAFGFDPEGEAARAILAELRDHDIGLCFVALGAPKQERFAAYGRIIAPSVGFASIGAGLDFVAGHQHRAPLWMRRLALEWLWRMLTNPLRLVPRYAKCFAILPRQVMEAARLRHRPR